MLPFCYIRILWFLFINLILILLQHLLVFHVEYFLIFVITFYVTCLVVIIQLMFNIFCANVTSEFKNLLIFIIIIIISYFIFLLLFTLFQWRSGCSLCPRCLFFLGMFATQFLKSMWWFFLSFIFHNNNTSAWFCFTR